MNQEESTEEADKGDKEITIGAIATEEINFNRGMFIQISTICTSASALHDDDFCRSSQLIHLPAEAMSSASRGWYNNNDLNAAREDNHQESNESVVPQADSSHSRHHHRHTNEDDTDHPFSR